MVVVLGSALNPFNTDLFATADVAVSVVPSKPPISRDKRVPRKMFLGGSSQVGSVVKGPKPPSFVSRCTVHKLNISTTLNETACALRSPADVHSCLWVSVIKMARRMHQNTLMVSGWPVPPSCPVIALINYYHIRTAFLK